jgi:hypothetical protein
MARIGRTVEERISLIATKEWGIVTRPELLAAGITDDETRHRVRVGLLIREYKGVYRVGHRAPSVEASYLAAVKACGEGAVLSGRAAAYLQGLLRIRNPPPPEVTTPTERRIAGIRTKRCRNMHPREHTTQRGIPITMVPRTLVDLSAEVDVETLARACHEAGVKYRTTPRQVNAVLTRRRNPPGSAKLRAVISGATKVSLSKLESGFLKFLKAAFLPLPETNRRVGTKRVDCRWPGHQLTVELQSYRFHNSRHAWEQDYRREREARKRGDEFRRFTYADVFEDQGYMLGELRTLLSATRSIAPRG